MRQREFPFVSFNKRGAARAPLFFFSSYFWLTIPLVTVLILSKGSFFG